MTVRVIQLKKNGVRRVALVEEPHLRLLEDCSSVYSLAREATVSGVELTSLIKQRATKDFLEYDSLYQRKSEWQLLPPVDHPDEPARCLISGTGLTHLGSAHDRQAMHATSAELTDSMRMYRWGIEGGRPEPGQIGTPPEWFYKGLGTILHAHGEPLDVPAYAEDGGGEAEIAGIYLIDPDGRPRRLGMAIGNEFSDHRFEKKNYLNLAGSKLQAQFTSVPGEVTMERAGTVLWRKKVLTGEAEMCHSMQNIEHHHFKFEAHRCPGDVHVHFLGAYCLSFGDNIELAGGDVMEIGFKGFGRPLRNPVCATRSAPVLVDVIPLG